MKYNPNKTISAGENKIIILYTDSKKHYNVVYDKEKDVLTDLQLYGNNFIGQKYQEIVSTESKIQHKLYKTALNGLSFYSKEEILKLSFKEKNNIIVTHKKVQNILNKWKQEICHKKLSSFLNKFFGKSTLAKDLANYPDYFDEFNKNTNSFQELGITKDMIIKKLILAGILPKNYYQLT